MDELRGGSARWCADCGAVLASGQAHCHACGLDSKSPVARDAERANGELHRIRAHLSQLTEQQQSWLTYRTEILAIAPRARVDLGAALDAPRAAPAVADAAITGPEVVASTHPFARPAAGAQAPQAQTSQNPPAPQAVSALATGSSSSSSTAQNFQPPAPYTSVRPPARPMNTRADAMRPAKRLTAPVLLGVAGAALFILAGIVFVAASWSTTGPALRMAILIAFAAVFAWLARMATRHDFTAVGGALGVVSAAFVGVGVFALTLGPSGPAPYTTAIAVLVAAIAGLGLSRLKIKAVGEVASAAVIFAVEAGAVEGAWRSWDLIVAMSTYVFVVSVGGVAILFARRMWRAAAQRAIATYGGITVVLIGAFVAVCTPLSAEGVDGLALGVVATSLAVCVGLAAWRPAWAPGVLAGVLTIGSASSASMWNLTVGQLAVVVAIAAMITVLGLGRVPLAWRTSGLWGLVPALAGSGLVIVLPLVDRVPRAFFGIGLLGDLSLSGVGGLSWYGCALVMLAALPLITSRWVPAALKESAWVQGAAATSFAVGTVFLGLDAAHVAARGAAAAGVGLTVAAALQWFAANLWGSRRATTVRAVAVALTAIGGLHGAAAIVESTGTRAQFVWGAVAVVVALIALAGAAVRQRYAVGAWTLVAAVSACAVTWHVSESLGAVIVAAAVTGLLIAAATTRVPTGYVAPALIGCVPAYVVAGSGVAVAVVTAFQDSFSSHSANAPAGYIWTLFASTCVVLAGPILASLAHRVGVDSPSLVTRIVSGTGVLALAVTSLARLQQGVADVGSLGLIVADASAAALAAAVGAAAYGLVALVPWWRPARAVVGIGAVGLVSMHGLVSLARLTSSTDDLWWTVGAVMCAALALGIAARWYPAVALAPAVGLASLVAPAALTLHHGEIAFATAAVLAAAIAWIARATSGTIRVATLIGGIAVMCVAVIGSLVVSGVVLMALGSTWAGEAINGRPWLLIVAAAVAIALLAWSPVRKIAGGIVAVALAVMAGLVPAPVGWIALAVIGAASTEASARWRSRLGLHPLVPLGLGIASVAWSIGASWSAAVSLAALAVAAIWTAKRATDGGVSAFALVISPIAGSVAMFLALHSLNVDTGVAVAIAAGTAFTMPLVAAAVGLDPRRLVTIWLLGVTSAVGPVFTGDLGLAGLVVVLGCAAWFTLSTMGVARARWVAIGGLSVAAMLLAADVGIATLEVYTAVPALSMIVVGLWWLKRDPHIRTYFALAPGLGAALVPSYIALAIHPGVLARTLALVGAALVLAVVGVARRWFAPLLATAVTAVVVALSQALAGESVLPLWVSVSIIGAVLFALAILAERIKAMR